MSAPAPPIYLFGIVRVNPDRDVDRGDLDLVTAKLGRPRLLPCGDLAAIVSDLTLPAGASLTEMLRDNRQAEEMVLDHHRVLDALTGRHTVLPLRFGAVFPDEQSVKAVLEQDDKQWHEAFDRINGALEWGLKIYCARDLLGRRLTGESPALAELERTIADTPDGKAFFLRRRLGRLIEAEVEQAIARCLDNTADRLNGAVREMAPGKIHMAEVHGREGDMIFNGACLVDRNLEQRFFDLIEDFRGANQRLGFEYETTGPWPSYSFTDCRLGSTERGP